MGDYRKRLDRYQKQKSVKENVQFVVAVVTCIGLVLLTSGFLTQLYIWRASNL